MAIAVFLAQQAAAFAQVEDKPFVQEETRRDLDFERPPSDPIQDFSYDFGLWYHFEFLNFEDEPFRDDRTLRFHDLRLWVNTVYRDWLTLYARVYNQVFDYNSGDQFGSDDNEAKLVRLDQGYLETKLDNVRLRLGRQFHTLGFGTVYNAVADGIAVEAKEAAFEVRAFSLLSIHTDHDIDRSRPDAGRSDRWYTGLQIDWLGVPGQRLFLLGMSQTDRNDEDPGQPNQDYEYDSQYLGLGLRGTALSDTVHFVELLHESGESTASGSTERDKIDAWGFRSGITWTPDEETRPSLFLEYMWGQGDSDRRSPTNTVGGNDSGTVDTGFLPFGFVQTGFSLAPRLSNLHIVRLGGELRPFAPERLDFGAVAYYYRKNKEEAGISDNRADAPDADVGWELDAYARWRLYDDVGVHVRYGIFFPGDAYSAEDDARQFVSVGVTFVY